MKKGIILLLIVLFGVLSVSVVYGLGDFDSCSLRCSDELGTMSCISSCEGCTGDTFCTIIGEEDADDFEKGCEAVDRGNNTWDLVCINGYIKLPSVCVDNRKFMILNCHSCGNGEIDAPEECDLGEFNGLPNSGCSADCDFIPAPPAIPEFSFGTIIAALIVVGLGTAFFIRRRK